MHTDFRPSSFLPQPTAENILSYPAHSSKHQKGSESCQITEALVSERRDFGQACGGLGQAGDVVDITGGGVLLAAEENAVRRVDGGILIEIIVGSQKEANLIPHRDCVGDVLRMWNV